VTSRFIDRPYTWVAISKGGTAFWEADYGSMTAVSETVRVERLALVATEDPDDTTKHVAVAVPPEGSPVAFTRVTIVVPTGANGEPLPEDQYTVPVSVIGFRGDAFGTDVLTWVYPDGSVLVTDRDVDEVT